MVSRRGMRSLGIAAVGAMSLCAATARAEDPDLRTALQHRIATQMRDIPGMMAGDEPHGIARVAFTVGDDGRTHAVRISGTSGDARVDHEAIRLVSSFHDLPHGGNPTMVNYAVLQYGTMDDAQEPVRTRQRLDAAVKVAYAQIDSDRRLAMADSPKAVVSAPSGGVATLAATTAMASAH